MNNGIENVLITGASSGIGAALAQYYAQRGIKNLFIAGRNEQRLMQIVQYCQRDGLRIFPKVLNVKNRNEVYEWLYECEKIAPLNLVFANAGVSTGEETPENIYNTFSTNIFGVLNTVTPAIELYQKRPHGRKIIAVTASIAGYHGLSGCPSYSASKACVKAYGEALRPRLAREGIQVNVICPGFVRSRITDKNTCPMPFFMEADKAAEIIGRRIDRNVGLIAFPWPMRLASWLVAIMPNCISNFIYSKLPYKV